MMLKLCPFDRLNELVSESGSVSPEKWRMTIIPAELRILAGKQISPGLARAELMR
jgi:hypothetical protein